MYKCHVENPEALGGGTVYLVGRSRRDGQTLACGEEGHDSEGKIGNMKEGHTVIIQYKGTRGTGTQERRCIYESLPVCVS